MRPIPFAEQAAHTPARRLFVPAGPGPITGFLLPTRRATLLKALIPLGQLFADQMGIVLLQEVNSLSDIHHFQILQVLLAPLHDRGLHNRARRGLEEKLREIRLLGLGVVSHSRGHVGWMSFYRNSVGPAPKRLAALRILERFPIPDKTVSLSDVSQGR
jgi:hypothetical protein